MESVERVSKNKTTEYKVHNINSACITNKDLIINYLLIIYDNCINESVNTVMKTCFKANSVENIKLSS